MYSLGIQVFVIGHLEQGQQYVAACLSGPGPAGNTKAIAMTGNLNIETLLDLSEVFVKLAAEVCEAAIVGGLENDVPRNLDSVQSILETTQRPDCLQAAHGGNSVVLR